MRVKNRISALSFCAILSLSLVGCASIHGMGSTKQQQYRNAINDELNGSLKERDVVHLNSRLNKSGEINGIKYNYNSIEVSKVAPNGLDKDFFNIDANDNGNENETVVVIRFNVENTSNKNINFDAGGSELITDTNEQVKPGEWQPSEFDGKFIGKCKKSGEVIYFLKKSKPQDVKRVMVKVPLPRTINGSNVSKSTTFTFNTY